MSVCHHGTPEEFRMAMSISSFKSLFKSHFSCLDFLLSCFYCFVVVIFLIVFIISNVLIPVLMFFTYFLTPKSQSFPKSNQLEA